MQLSLENLTVSSGDDVLLGPITFDQSLIGITAVLGPNGAGKSLFLAACHGTLTLSDGVVQWGGITADQNRATRGYMLQTPVVLRRTVQANIDFALQSHGIARADRKAKIDAALHRARLSDRANTPAATLSGGELRRMNLARALVADPEVLLLDEPFAGLDPAATQDMEAIISDVARSTPILMAHHDLVQTRRMAHRVLFFTNGRLRENALAKDFFSQPKSDDAVHFLQGQLL
ncbi:ATP-binding cassette domain-containing protein [Amylibacter sp. IMCC11727]|uniref:ATP-binding cassette domain-containing protein n=1 Tax=Amylibacter sp. IMCC11727 TaxID=3039851 RepID=UPI00244E2C02|nr:ATP-binding cassette domain-containing protein [Amylibacter sp. IMCC11727]WGI22970.1 ATP-binding cassette domain-containing protein [Amylibacter sp. IMCC11727]